MHLSFISFVFHERSVIGGSKYRTVGLPARVALMLFVRCFSLHKELYLLQAGLKLQPFVACVKEHASWVALCAACVMEHVLSILPAAAYAGEHVSTIRRAAACVAQYVLWFAQQAAYTEQDELRITHRKLYVNTQTNYQYQ